MPLRLRLPVAPRAAGVLLGSALLFAAVAAAPGVRAQTFEEATHDVGNVGLTVTNAGIVGRSTLTSARTGAPSFEYPLDSGVEHLFEAGLWVGAIRGDGLVTVRTAAITSSGGYRPGAAGYELSQSTPITRRSSLPESPAFTPIAVSHQDYLSTLSDTARFVPGTFTPTPDPQGQLGMRVETRSYSYNFPFAESFVIVEYEIHNESDAAWDSVYVGMFEDLVVRNLNTTETGTQYFNKGGRGFLGYPEYDAEGNLIDAVTDSQFVSYAFNAGGPEESLNTYGSIAFLGAEWDETGAGARFFHPFLQEEYEAEGLPSPRVNPRWWKFTSANPELTRPADDAESYRRMGAPLRIDDPVPGDADVRPLRQRLREDGQTSNGNWIGLIPIGPFPRVEPGGSITAVFAFVAALKPEEFQTTAGRPLDTDAARVNLRTNVFWAMRTYAGEDLNYNGRLDPGEDADGNGQLDRYRIPEPPRSPRVHVETDRGQVTLYWDDSAEQSVDPVSGLADFEGYRVYRSDPGDDRAGNLFNEAGMVAQYDRAGNGVGFNTGFEPVRLPEPVTFPGDTTRYTYRYTETGLLSGWQYAFAVTAFDRGDAGAGLPSFESAKTSGAIRVFPGAAPVADAAVPVGVYPNPYRVNAAWDGAQNSQRKLYFTNLPARCQIRVYTLAGEIVAEMDHDAATYTGDTPWYEAFSAEGRVAAGGEHAWDILSENRLSISTGLYLFSVRDLDTGETQTGRFAVIR